MDPCQSLRVQGQAQALVWRRVREGARQQPESEPWPGQQCGVGKLRQGPSG